MAIIFNLKKRIFYKNGSYLKLVANNNISYQYKIDVYKDS